MENPTALQKGMMEDPFVIRSVDSDHDSSASMKALGTMEDDMDVFEEEPTISSHRFQTKRMDHRHEHRVGQAKYRTPPEKSYQNRYSYASVVKDRGIHIDLSQAWQRSMLLQLEKLDHGGEVRPERKPELMVLGHSESHDFAYAVEKDDITLATATSSACPTKDQTIYRLDSSCNTSLGGDGCRPPSFPRQAAQSRRHRTRYSQRDAMPTTEEKCEEKCQDGFALYDCGIVQTDFETQRPFSRMMVDPCRGVVNSTNTSTSRAKSVNRRHETRPYLEATPSEENDPSNGAQEACFCLGYNILDYWIPPVARKSEQLRMRSSQKRPRQLRHSEELHKASTKPAAQRIHSRTGQIHHSDPSGSYAYQTYEDRDDLLMT